MIPLDEQRAQAHAVAQISVSSVSARATVPAHQLSSYLCLHVNPGIELRECARHALHVTPRVIDFRGGNLTTLHTSLH